MHGGESQPLRGSNMAHHMQTLSHLSAFCLFYFIFGPGIHLYNPFTVVQIPEFLTFYG